MKQLGAELQAKHPLGGSGALDWIICGIVELIRNRKTRQPMAPFNGTSDEMTALWDASSANRGFTLSFAGRNTPVFTNPRCASTSSSCSEAFAIIDRGLEITDKAVN